MKNLLLLLTVLPLLNSSCIRPGRNFETYTPPADPDYREEKNWAALPSKIDGADFVPEGTGDKDNQSTAEADVFYVHPTVYFGRKTWNAEIDDKRVNDRVDKVTMKNQASVFNASCKVYAPRYRQATLYAFVDPGTNGRKALDEAYKDVKAAFQYYLKNYNNGRPIIIAGHSQGTNHATRLLKDFFENDPRLYKQLVAAYVIGGDVKQKQFTKIQPCENSKQTGCLIAWHSMKWGKPEPKPRPGKETAVAHDGYGKNEFVNPLTWKRDTVYAPKSMNYGSLPRNKKEIVTNAADAKISTEFMVWVHQPEMQGFPKTDNYHIADYGLFYMNIRKNVAQRVQEFLKK